MGGINVALIDAFLRQTVTVRPYVREGSGGPIYGPEEHRKCRIEPCLTLTRQSGVSGTLDDDPARATMFCTGREIPRRSIVIHEGEEYTVTRCDILRTFTEDHLEVTLS